MKTTLSIILFLLCIVTNPNRIDAQWMNVPTGLPDNENAFYVTDQIVFLVGNSGLPLPDINGMVSKSLNGGKTFSPVLNEPDGGYSAVHFNNSQVGFIAGDHQADAVVLKTTNGGNNWQTISLDAFVPSFKEFYFINDNIGFLVGGFGENLLFKTTDAGSTWDKMVVPFGSGMMDIRFFDDTRGYVASFDGKIILTDNQGETWEELQTLPPNDGIDAVYFINANLGLVANDDGELFRTENGGMTWTPIPLPDAKSPFYTRFHFVNDITGFLHHSDDVGRNLYHTTDAGLSWTKIYSQNAFLLWEFITFNPSNTKALIGGFNNLQLNENVAGLIETTAIKPVTETPVLFNVNPNPAINQINVSIELESSVPVRINLLNALGIIEESKYLDYHEIETTFDLTSKATGIYFIQAETEKGVVVKSFIKI